jgi:uncharacterized repeat protein (TIGR04138 family)
MSHDAANDEVFARQLRDTAAKSAYPYEAFLFVYQTLPSSFSPELPYDHIDAAELCWRLRDRAIVDFGSAARERLASWSVQSCYDFGNIVYALVDAGLIKKTEQDSRADFDSVFGFDDAFHEGAKPRKRNTRTQWRLSTLFAITTVAAIASAGFGRLGIGGAAGTLLSSWLAVIGVYCVIEGVRDRSKGWVISIGMGVMCCALAAAMYIGIMVAR